MGRRIGEYRRRAFRDVDYNPEERSPLNMVHVILTGRNAHPTIIDLADTVTAMREVKHAYQKGIGAQRRVEY